MKLRLLFSLFAFMTLVSLNAQIETVGLIGTATPGGWDVDTNMVQDPDSAHLWTMTINLVAGEAKFRANDDWAINWGDSAFPLGVGTQDGPNIPVANAGLYDITFNSNTGEYYFSVVSDIGIIGSASLFGWDADVNMFQGDADTNVYTLRLVLSSGEAKFRQNDDWAVNWGASDFPSGIGVQNGPNIPIPMAGEYFITFNKSTGAYNFQLTGFADVSIVGDATPGGWGAGTSMTSTGPDQWSLNIGLTDGGLQFVADAGVMTWGGPDFPNGIATNINDTIPVTAGLYVITFNTQTLVYNFAEVILYSTVGIIGSATPGGWDSDTDMEQDGTDPSVWRLRIVLTDGEAKFRAENDWAVNWGSTDFPVGTGVQNGDNIPITAGEYNITFNSFTGAYEFVEVFQTMGIIGDATPGGWDADTDMEPNGGPNDWKVRVILTDGEAKFRANHDWAYNWGAGDFPSGIAVRDGANIPITAGEYNVFFNSLTGAYNFMELRIYSSVGLIGTGTEFGEWTTDVQMIKDATDENLWKLQSVNLVDGECKFRAEGAWAVNWGATDWPTGTGTQDGPNIPITGGTYGVTLNSATGEYAFGDPLSSTKDVLNPSSIKAFPNPADNLLNLDLSAIELKGEVNLSVFDIQGKLVLSEVQPGEAHMQLDVASLQDGYYTLHISNDKYIIGKKFVIAR
ncbi:MAG TPA: SusF/SusE family outer membrane protein [Saprospiraceae bacterium]|nr:SusF/SusE family outer membrane protein [Saprospiraceae bacterium]